MVAISALSLARLVSILLLIWTAKMPFPKTTTADVRLQANFPLYDFVKAARR